MKIQVLVICQYHIGYFHCLIHKNTLFLQVPTSPYTSSNFCSESTEKYLHFVNSLSTVYLLHWTRHGSKEVKMWLMICSNANVQGGRIMVLVSWAPFLNRNLGQYNATSKVFPYQSLRASTICTFSKRDTIVSFLSAIFFQEKECKWSVQCMRNIFNAWRWLSLKYFLC